MAIKLKISSPPKGVNFPGNQYQVRNDGIPKDDVEMFNSGFVNMIEMAHWFVAFTENYEKVYDTVIVG